MSRRIVLVAFVSLVLTVSSYGREGFGWSKKAVDIDKTIPPAINVSGTRVNVSVDSERTRKAAEAKRLRDETEKAILAGDKKLEAVPNGDFNVSIALDRLDVDQHNESKVDYESQKTKDKNGKTTYVSVPVTKNFTRVHGEVGGTYRITDAKGRLIDSGDIDRKYDEDFEYVAPSLDKVETGLFEGAAAKIARRIVPTRQKTRVLLPKGSFEQLIPLAESGKWGQYLDAVNSMRPLNDPASEAYRQYALGVANEAMAYSDPDPKKGLELLRAAAEHYQAAATSNKDEKLFSEAYASLLGAASAPIARAEASVKAYEAWTSGPTAPSATASVQRTTSGSSTLHNQSVIDMAKAGLSDENIMLAIDSARSIEFDTTPDGLIALSKAGVSRNVIAHMQKGARK